MTAFSCHRPKFAPVWVFLVTFLLIISLSIPWVSAQEENKPKPKEWQINGIVAALDDGYDQVKEYALSELNKYYIKKINKPEKIIKKIANILKDENVKGYVRSGAAEALAKFGEPAAKYIPNILNLLKDEKVDSSVRSGAAQALGKFGESTAKYIPDIVNILKDEKVSSSVRSGAAEALAKFGEPAAKYIPDILNLLKDEKVDSSVRSGAAQALGKFGESAAKYIPDILNLLKDENVDLHFVRNSAARALSTFGEPEAKYIPDILNLLKDEKVDSYVRSLAAQALGKFGELELKQAVVILNNLYDPSHSEYKQWRFLTYFTGGGTKEVKTLLTWLGYSQTVPQQIKYDEAKETLEIFLEVWKPTKDLRRLRNDLADKIGRIAKDKSVTWKALDISLLQKHHDNLKTAGYNEADTIQRIINNLQFWKWFFIAKDIILIHLAIWLILTLIYPTFTPVLAPLFWNPWLRRILGFGYIGLLLTLVPWSRERLLQPFKPLLLGDAGLDNFVEQGYFGESYVKVPPGSIPVLDQNQNLLDNTITVVATTESNPEIFRPLSLINAFSKRNTFAFVTIINIFLRNRLWRKRSPQKTNSLNKYSPKYITSQVQPITQAIPSLQGQIVLEGESGLGKSMFLRHLANNSRRILVYLPAQKCDKGVIKAIYAKLKEQVNDFKFLKNLIYNGALDICIDGLNEVTADTRAKISQFAESYFRGNIIMTTQPLDWIPPSTAKKYELQPLEREQIEQFLLLRGETIGEWRLGTGEDKGINASFTQYDQACSNYLAEAFNEQQSPEDLAVTKRILSNPMDLTLVALMLSQGQQPNLFRLQEQQYQLMAAEYQREYQREFPLKKFSEAVYQMRLYDETIIPSEEFGSELVCLGNEKYKMVISRLWENDKGEPETTWYFRHDKIMEFFLVQNFRGAGEAIQERIQKHINDPRFRGVYLLLANLLPLDDAVELRERIIDYAANSKDHTLSDKFVQLLQLRLPLKWTQGAKVKSLLQQHEQKTQYLDLVAKFLEQVDATVKREQKLYLTIENIESSLSNYAPFPVVIAIDTPTDEDISHLVKLSQQLKAESTTETEITIERSPKAGLLIYKIPPDPAARMEIAKVRLRDNFLLIPIPITSVEKALSDKENCIGLLDEYIDRYFQHADFFDDRNAITDTLSFFGRTEILQRLGEELLRHQALGLFGLRKSGKTSVLIQLGFMLREYPIIHIDLQSYGGSRYAVDLFNKIIDGLSSLESETPFPQFAPFPREQPAAELTAEFIQRVNEYVSVIQNQTKYHNQKKYKLPILCFLDEVERIIPTPEDDREKAEEFNAFFGALRVLCQEKKMSLLVADVHPDCNRINSWTQAGVATNPVFSFFKEIFLPPFSEEETQDMLVNLGKLMGLEFDTATPQQIHYQSGGHPFVSRQIARFLTQKIKDQYSSVKNSFETNNTVETRHVSLRERFANASPPKNSGLSEPYLIKNKQDLPHQNSNTLIEWGMVEKYLKKTLTQRGQLKNYLEKSIWEDLEKRNFQVAIAVLQCIACNEDSQRKITQTALFNQLKSKFKTNQLLNACNWLINVGLLYEEEVEEQKVEDSEVQNQEVQTQEDRTQEVHIQEIQTQEIQSNELYHIRIRLLSRWIYMQMTEEEIEQCTIL
ncbi:HEAT repeat domain-containing protein [Mastigocoleus sp. MO_188.B34]|uniref:HEAT repeat domain-containing protein n=1 Tax=Mastigocoleus sp. MO_188.B34 TaxID=3036635 RepID=UPI0034511BE5